MNLLGKLVNDGDTKETDSLHYLEDVEVMVRSIVLCTLRYWQR